MHLRANYCPICGKKTILRAVGGFERDACPDVSCGWIQYTKAAIGVGALVIRDGKALMVERGIPPVGRWTIPSGYVEQRDNIGIAVAREVKEETSLDVTPLGIIFIRNTPRNRHNDIYVGFLCETIDDAEPVPDGDESTQARFVHPDEFDDMDVSVFSRRVIEGYLKHRPEPLPLIDFKWQPDAFIYALL